MKKSVAILFICLFISALSFAQSNDEEVIKKVCLAETTAYRNLDYDTWASCHVQSADEQLSWNEANGYGFEIGWQEISKGMKDWFATAKKEVTKIASDNYTIVIRGNMAFAAYNTTNENVEGKVTKLREYRTLLHINGQWKILSVQAYVDFTSGK